MSWQAGTFWLIRHLSFSSLIFSVQAKSSKRFEITFETSRRSIDCWPHVSLLSWTTCPEIRWIAFLTKIDATVYEEINLKSSRRRYVYTHTHSSNTTTVFQIIIHLYQYPMLLLAMTKSNTKNSIYIIYEFLYQTHTYIQTLYDNVEVFD